MSRKSPSFVALEKAFWTFVDQECPHPVQSRHRYAWVRENLSFEYDGILYRRSSITVPRGGAQAPGSASFMVTYSGSDGSVIEDRQAARSLVA
jgi:hypothetical protein